MDHTTKTMLGGMAAVAVACFVSFAAAMLLPALGVANASLGMLLTAVCAALSGYVVFTVISR